MKNEIKHSGVIFDIVGNRVDVAVTPESACASCKAASLCAIGDKEEKIVSVPDVYPGIYSVGEKVEVSVARAMGIKAVLLAYILPLLIILSTLVVMLSAGAGEPVAGLVSLLVAGVYYVCLYFFRKQIRSEIIFKINKI